MKKHNKKAAYINYSVLAQILGSVKSWTLIIDLILTKEQAEMLTLKRGLCSCRFGKYR